MTPRDQLKPPATAGVELGPDLLALVELLARHNHDVWTRLRLADGWRHGVRRDDIRKEHPGLVPYEELPESEKEYDRSCTRETLKAVIALGYQITKV